MTEIDYKGRIGLVLENQAYRTIILPELGGKVASFYSKKKDFELIYPSQADLLDLPKKYGDFGQSNPCGIDDCWPNIDACIGDYGHHKINYPDHGDTWFRPFDYAFDSGTLKTTCHSDLLPYIYEKDFNLTEDKLTITHHIVNVGDHPIEGFYTFHGLMVCASDMKFILPQEVQEVLNVHHSSDILGLRDTIHPYPHAKDLQGNPYSLNQTAGPDAGKCEKFYALNPVAEGKCGAYYPRLNTYAIIEFNQDALPYLGLWLNEKADGQTFNFALEPSNGFYDNLDIAKKNKKCPILHPGESLDFKMSFSISDRY